MGSSRSGLLHRVSLPLSPVVQFGTFLKVVVLNEVRPDGECKSGCIPDSTSATPNAFDILTEAQSKQRTPAQIIEQNRKALQCSACPQRKCGLYWRSDEVDSVGVNFVKSLCEALFIVH